jgi:hypothetical protein
VLLQTIFNIGAALIVARLGGSMQDVSELIPFFLRISRYFCGVMYMVTTLPAKVPEWGIKLLSLNPPAVFISLVRVALMTTYRNDAPGNKPYNAAMCTVFKGDPGGTSTVIGHNLVVGHKLVPLPPSGASLVNDHHVVNATLQAFCHAVVTNNDLWLAGIGWGVGFFLIGIVFFWQAESLYGRG